MNLLVLSIGFTLSCLLLLYILGAMARREYERKVKENEELDNAVEVGEYFKK